MLAHSEYQEPGALAAESRSRPLGHVGQERAAAGTGWGWLVGPCTLPPEGLHGASSVGDGLPGVSAVASPQESEEEDGDAVDEDTGSEETGSELRDDQTDTSSAEVPSARPRRAVTLRSSSEPERRPPVERPRRGRRAQAASCTEGAEQGVATGQDPAEVTAAGPKLGCGGGAAHSVSKKEGLAWGLHV